MSRVQGSVERGPSRATGNWSNGPESSRRDAGCHATVYWQRTPNWKKVAFRNLPISTGLPSRDSLGVHHAISRLLGQFETFRACWAGGESRDFVAATSQATRTGVRRSRDNAAFSAEKRGESREETAGEWRKAQRILFGSTLSFSSPALLPRTRQWRRPRRLETGIEIRHPPGTAVVPSTLVFPRLIVTHCPMVKSQRTAAPLHRSIFLVSRRCHYNRNDCCRQT